MRPGPDRAAPSCLGARVCILDGQYLAALAAVRSLGRAGARVAVCAAEHVPTVVGFASRYASETRRIPDAARSAEGFRTALAGAAAGAGVVLPCALASIRALAGAPEWSDHVLLPPPESLEHAVDKARLAATAAALGILVPRTFGPGEDVPFPAVVKYRHGEALGLKPEQRYAIVRDRMELEAVHRRMAGRQPDPVVQEWLPGEGRGCSAICDRRGRPAAFFCHRRLREYPVRGGPSTWAESIEDPQLVGWTARLLRHLHWRGHAMVEYKVGPDGRPRLLEINPRPWGTYALAIAAGVDFPVLYCALVRGGAVPVPRYRSGVRLRFWAKDALAARAAGVGVAAYVGQALRAPGVPAVFQWADPAPSAAYARRVLSRAGRAGGNA